jgi:hypothetical protein
MYLLGWRSLVDTCARYVAPAVVAAVQMLPQAVLRYALHVPRVNGSEHHVRTTAWPVAARRR